MIPDAVLIGALRIGTVSLIAYWCWTDARKNEGRGTEERTAMIDTLMGAPECAAPHDSPAALARNRIPIDPADPPLTYKGRKAREVVIVKPDYFWAYDEWVGATGYIRGRDAGLAKVQVAWQKRDDGRLAAEMIYLYPEEYRHADGKYRKDRKPAAVAALPG